MLSGGEMQSRGAALRYFGLDAKWGILLWRRAYRLGLCCRGVRASRSMYQEPMVMQSAASRAPATANGSAGPVRSEAKSVRSVSRQCEDAGAKWRESVHAIAAGM